MGGIVWGLFFAIATASGALFLNTQRQLAEDSLNAQAEAISGSMLLYRNHVLKFAAANPTSDGNIPDASLSLPAWYSKQAGVSNYVGGGKGYVYYSGGNMELAYRLLKKSNNSVLTGIKRGAYLYNPLTGTTAISLPVQIPDQSVVYASP